MKPTNKPKRLVYTVMVEVVNLPIDPTKQSFRELIDIFESVELANAAARQCALFGTYQNRFRPSKIEIERGELLTSKLVHDSDYLVEGRAKLSLANRYFNWHTGCLTYTSIVKDSPAVRGFPPIKSRRVISHVKERYLMDISKPMTEAIAANESRFLPRSLSFKKYSDPERTRRTAGTPPIPMSFDFHKPWQQEMLPSFSESSSTLVSQASNFSTPALETDGFEKSFFSQDPYADNSVFQSIQVAVRNEALHSQLLLPRQPQELVPTNEEFEEAQGSDHGNSEIEDLIDLSDFEIKRPNRRSSTIQGSSPEARYAHDEHLTDIKFTKTYSHNDMHITMEGKRKSRRSVLPDPLIINAKESSKDGILFTDSTDESDTRSRRDSGDSSVWYDSLETQDGFSTRASKRSTISNMASHYPCPPHNISENNTLLVGVESMEQEKDLEHAAHLASIQPEAFGLGTFSGTRVCQFLQEIKSAEDRSGLGAGPGLAKLVARCLVGNAELWFRGLSSSRQGELLNSSDEFYKAIHREFSYQIPKETEEALAYHYHPKIHQSIRSYCYTKLVRLRQTMPNISDDDSMELIWKGLERHCPKLAMASSSCSSLQELKEEMFRSASLLMKEKKNGPSRRSTRMANERPTSSRGRQLNLREIY